MGTMRTLYKLTDQNHQTYNNTQWGPGVAHAATGQGNLCGPGWLHAYTHPLLAVLLNPIHASIHSPVLWEAEGLVGAEDNEPKVGCTYLRTTQEIPLPSVTTTQRVAFGILCALEVYDNKAFVAWAHRWLAGDDRSGAAAATAAKAATAWATAEWAAARAAEWAAKTAATAAAKADGRIDLIALAQKAVEE